LDASVSVAIEDSVPGLIFGGSLIEGFKESDFLRRGDKKQSN